jgi:adenosylhomocysteinase
VLADLRRFLKPSDKFVVVEDGGFIAPLLHSVDFSDMREGCIGVVEQTSKGIKNDHVLANASGLKIPVVSVAESWLKLRLEAPEVGEALGFVVEHFVRRYLKRPLNLKVLVIGYGAVGRELAMSLANRGATVTVYDNDPRKQVEATVQRPYHFRVLSDLGDISGQELIMGTTGTTSLDLDILLKASDGTILASGSSDRLEFDIDGIRSHLANPVDESVVLDAYVTWYRLNDGRRLGMLCDGYPINFVLGEGIAKSVVDPILAELIAGAVLLADGKITTPGINSVPEDLESEFWSEYERIASRSGPRSAI